MVCHDAWFFGMHMFFHKVQCSPLLLQRQTSCPAHMRLAFSACWLATCRPAVTTVEQRLHLLQRMHMLLLTLFPSTAAIAWCAHCACLVCR